jgi:hypothetical protein
VLYKGHPAGDGRPDFVIGGSLVVELKAVAGVVAVHRAQVLSYLKAMNRRLGLLLNFREAMMKHGIHRVVLGACFARSEGEESADDVHEAQEARGRSVVSGGNAPVPLQVMEEDLDAIA